MRRRKPRQMTGVARRRIAGAREVTSELCELDKTAR